MEKVKEVVKEVVKEDELVPPTPPVVEEKEVVKEVVKKEEVVLEYKVETIATQTEPVIVFGEEQFSIHQALVLLLNKVSKLEKALL